MMSRKVFAFLVILTSTQVWAQTLSPLNSHNACRAHITRQELLKGIPRHLLTAIAKVESGRWHKERKEIVAWPWTVNAEGEGRYFATKAEAVAAVRQLMARGVKSIDVGCAQINLHHHKHAFRTLEEAFDPKTNVEYAADFLLQLKNTQGSWTKAVAYYHSATPAHHIPYARKVYDIWTKERQKGLGEWYAEAQQAVGRIEASRPVWGRTIRPLSAASPRLHRVAHPAQKAIAQGPATYTPSQTKATLARYRQAALQSYRKNAAASQGGEAASQQEARPVWGRMVRVSRPVMHRVSPAKAVEMKKLLRPRGVRPLK
ncbi:MAG: lytic transglycosylase domain-containing protein [Holosporales bacterium]